MSAPDGTTLEEIGWNFLERQAAVVVLRVDSRGTILAANSYARELTGRPLVSGSLGELLIASTESADLKRWLTPSAEPRVMNVRTPDGLSQTLYVTSVQAGADLVLLGQADPKEQERLRREYQEMNQELVQLGRDLALANAELVRLNALKNKFLGMASHDLRKPTGSILNRAELLLEDAALGSSPDASRSIRQIIASADAMARLINDFLDVSVIEADRLSLDIQVVEQERMVAAALDLVRSAAAERDIELRTSLDKSSSRLRVDGQKMEQVLTNLLSNAIEHAPYGSCVSVSSQRAGGDTLLGRESRGRDRPGTTAAPL